MFYNVLGKQSNDQGDNVGENRQIPIIASLGFDNELSSGYKDTLFHLFNAHV